MTRLIELAPFEVFHMGGHWAEEPHTPLDVATKTTLEGLGCLPSSVPMPKTQLHVR